MPLVLARFAVSLSLDGAAWRVFDRIDRLLTSMITVQRIRSSDLRLLSHCTLSKLFNSCDKVSERGHSAKTSGGDRRSPYSWDTHAIRYQRWTPSWNICGRPSRRANLFILLAGRRSLKAISSVRAQSGGLWRSFNSSAFVSRAREGI